MAYDLQYMEGIIKARTVRECFLVDLPGPRRRFGPRLILKALVDQKYGSYVCFRMYQRSVWTQLRLESRTGLFGKISRSRLLVQRHISNLFYRLMYVVFRTTISAFAEFCPGVDATFDNLGITAGASIRSGVFFAGGVTLVNHGGFAPTILEGANLLSGCVVIGGVTVGANATVTANSVVITDVPEGATVLGNPAKVVYRRPIE